MHFIRESLRLRPLELDDDRRKLEEARRSEEAAAAQIKRLKMDVDRREVDVKKFDGDIEKLEVALNTARTYQEYTDIKEQIKRAQESRGKAEEEVLQKLTDLDNLEVARKAEAAEAAAEEKAFRRKEAEVEEVLRGLREQLARLEASREALLPGIDRE